MSKTLWFNKLVTFDLYNRKSEVTSIDLKNTIFYSCLYWICDGEYSLEVSSPGIDRPLTKPEHFARFVGYETKIETDESVEGRKRFKGRIVALDDGNVIRFDMDGKEYRIPFDAVAKAKLVLNDELWAEYVEAQEEE